MLGHYGHTTLIRHAIYLSVCLSVSVCRCIGLSICLAIIIIYLSTSIFHSFIHSFIKTVKQLTNCNFVHHNFRKLKKPEAEIK